MNRISILDCTLRDGGYVNDFAFGEFVIHDIIAKLSKSSIDIIECGFLKTGADDYDCSLFGSIEAITNAIGKKNPNLMYVAMVQYGAISINEISDCTLESVDGIRLTFHEHEIEPAFIMGRQLMDKGYKVFMQPVGTTTYTDDSLLSLIYKINSLNPFAFYMVDTLGTMYKKDLLKMFDLVDKNLNKNVNVGFHSHNNLQMSFANAQELMEVDTDRNIIVDASLYGMGRGAGNLNTELVAQYVNDNFTLKYDCLQILELIDEYIKPLNIKYKWGYDAAYYISSATGCHPNYAFFLLNKQTMRVQDIYALLNRLDVNKRALFDKDYIGEEYIKYMSHTVDDAMVLQQFSDVIGDKKVLLLAPGKTLRNSTMKINEIISKGDYYVVSVNFIPADIKTNAMFISNMKRFKNTRELYSRCSDDFKIIATSNITVGSNDRISVLNYSSYINEEQCISDNAGLMCINFLKKIGVTNLLLAGFDGFSEKIDDNFYDTKLNNTVDAERYRNMNVATKNKLQQISTQMSISFLTDSFYNKQ